MNRLVVLTASALTRTVRATGRCCVRKTRWVCGTILLPMPLSQGRKGKRREPQA